ncbi:hypothetical protein DPMN_011262 [Dreissena polymorpha]|uniref:Uncharacterized protein n=1 Tax=Dreissena polymorpha TaxID=45954 RepID=A0A9D4N3Q2_DREPO|nr:hypothetical protein DPMN_011262 [Dreissena polymorpha]
MKAVQVLEEDKNVKVVQRRERTKHERSQGCKGGKTHDSSPSNGEDGIHIIVALGVGGKTQ